MQDKTKICQSCTMPLSSEKAHGTNSDGSYNYDYCHHCFLNGKFTSEITMEKMIDISVKYAINHYGSEENARNAFMKIFPTLKRWKMNL